MPRVSTSGLLLRPVTQPPHPGPRPPGRLWQVGATALIQAANNGHEAVVLLLLEHNASVDAATQVVTRMRETVGCRGGGVDKGGGAGGPDGQEIGCLRGRGVG